MEFTKPTEVQQVLVDEMNHCVLVHAADGSTTVHGRKGSSPGEFHYPRGVVVLGSRAFVVDSWNHRVQVFELPEWKYCFEFGEFGTGPGQFFCPSSIAYFEPWLIVVDTNNARFSFHDRDGRFQFSANSVEESFPVQIHTDGAVIAVQYENGEWNNLAFV